MSDTGVVIPAAILAAFIMSRLFLMPEARAFPPAPHHLIYGIVRGESGYPITTADTEVILTNTTGVLLRTHLIPSPAPEMNYRLPVPLDSGLTAQAYKPTAMQPTVPFRLHVKIGMITYLPIEMSGDFKRLGQPAGETRLDLTLGEDVDGDGLPDAWERILITLLGGNLTLGDIRPEDDSDQDGMSNLEEYIAGTYAFDPEDGFKLSIVGVNEGRSVLEFTAIRGRSYSVRRSTELEQWAPVSFRIAAEGEQVRPREVYQATDVRLLRIEVEPESDGQPAAFYELMVE